jgi:hypothetical protein
VKPIHKDGDKANFSNYRPIAFLPIVSKVFEHVILDRHTHHLTRNNVINNFQFGFVAKFNTEIAVLHLLSNIFENIEKINGKQDLCQDFGLSVPDSRCGKKMIMNSF